MVWPCHGRTVDITEMGGVLHMRLRMRGYLLLLCILSRTAAGDDGSIPGAHQSENDHSRAVAITSEQVTEALKKIYDRSYQKNLPEMEKNPGRAIPVPPSPLIKKIFHIIIIVGLSVVLAWVLFFIFKNYIAPRIVRKSISADKGTELSEGLTAAQARDLSHAEALAQSGRLAEAIHIVLLAAIDWLGGSRALSLPVSFTSREIYSACKLSVNAREAFSDLIAMVEHVHFGGFFCTLEDYRTSLKWYRQITAQEGVP